jgi:hypothetical protein
MRKSLRTAIVCLLATLPAHADPIPPPGPTLTGTAVDPQGRPVAGAAVWLAPRFDLPDEPYDAYVKAGPAAVTGADGHFTMSLPAGRRRSTSALPAGSPGRSPSSSPQPGRSPWSYGRVPGSPVG